MNELPAELLSSIIEHATGLQQMRCLARQHFRFDPEGYRQALRQSQEVRIELFQLCLVSRSFRDIAQPLLHRSFYSDEGHSDRTELFLRTLADRNDLARLVEELHISFRQPSKRASSSKSNTIDTTNLDLLRSCQGLHSLIIEDTTGMYQNDSLTRLIFQYGTILSTRPRPHKGLKHLSLVFNCEDSYSSLNHMKHCLRLQGLVSLHLSGVYIDTTAEAIPARWSTYQVQEVYIEASIWTTQGISNFLQCCPKLEILELIASQYWGSDTIYCDVNFPALGGELRKYGSSLRRLTIDAQGAYGYQPFEDDDPDRTLGSLRALTNLQYLCIPLFQLLPETDELFIDLQSARYVGRPLGREKLLESLRATILPDSIQNVVLLQDWGANIHLDWDSTHEDGIQRSEYSSSPKLDRDSRFPTFDDRFCTWDEYITWQTQ